MVLRIVERPKKALESRLWQFFDPSRDAKPSLKLTNHLKQAVLLESIAWLGNNPVMQQSCCRQSRVADSCSLLLRMTAAAASLLYALVKI